MHFSTAWYHQPCFVERWTLLSVVLLMQVELFSCVFTDALPEFHLYPSKGSANTIFKIGGPDYLNSSRTRFRIGNQIFLPFGFEKVGYESIVGLEVSSLEGSFFSVQVTRNGRDFSDTGILFQYVHATLNDVHPVKVMKSGGTVVTIRGSGLSDGYYCRSNGLPSILVEGASTSSVLMKCEISIMEHAERSTSRIFISANPDLGLLSEGQTLHLLEEAKYLRLSDLEVQLQGSLFTDQSASVWCKLGNICSLGRIISATRMSCTDQIRQREGRHLQISMNQVDFTIVQDMHVAHVRDTVRNKRDREEEEHRISERKSRVALSRFLDAERVINARYTAISIANTMLQFHHYSDSSVSFTSMLPPTIDSLNPAVGTFGGAHMTWLTGKNFINDDVYKLHCSFGNISQSARFISSSIVTCDVPMVLKYGSVDVTILSSSTSSGVRTEAGLHYTLLARALVGSLAPKRGTARGGTVLHLRGSGFFNSWDLRCKFGSIQVNIAYVSEAEIRCFSPSRAHGESDMQVILSGRHVCGASAYMFVV